MKRPRTSILGQFDAATFLRDHWQRTPLFLPGAVRGFTSPISADELAGLACEEDVESRLVRHTPAEPWRLRHGPFAEEDFDSLEGSAWTLLVQDVDKHVPEVGALLAWVNFLPSWCVDDIMISVAGDGGSVGPHVDQYDVFLVQAAGTREWQLDRKCDPHDLLPDADLKILASFQADQVHLAQPGDVLYLPAGVGHWGVARGEAMTYSFGFRTPGAAELFQSLAESLAENRDGNRLPIRAFQEGCHRAEVPLDLASQVQLALSKEIEAVRGDAAAHGGWLGRLLSAAKPTLDVEPPDEPPPPEKLAAQVRGGDALLKDPRCKWLFSESPEGRCSLFVHGEVFELSPGASREFAGELCESPGWNAAWLTRQNPEYSVFELLAVLYGRGYVKFASDT